MSRKTPIGITFFEKVFGMVLIILGIILAYATYTSLAAAGPAAAFSLTAGALLIVLGFVLIIVKTK
jgi:uncharacterized membrane protein